MSKKKDEAGAPAAPFNNPFGALKAKLPELPSAPAPAEPKPPPAKAAPKGPARAVVRYERKGHGGKEATVVEHLELPARELEVWLKALKQGLGCGGRVEEGKLILQGDQRDRLPALLTARGVRKVTVS